MNKLVRYNDTYWSLVSLSDECFKKGRRYQKKFLSYSEEEKERISLSRSKSNIKELCLCNNFEYFITLTVSSKFDYYNRFDLENCLDNVKKLMKAYKRKTKDFKFLYIIEQHKNKAYHFHGMVKGIDPNDIYQNKEGFYSSHFFDKLGRNSFDKIKDYNACCSYITKYITKQCCRTDNNQIYFCSRGLKRADEELMIDTDLKSIFDNCFESQYCQKKDFDISKLSEKQKMKLKDYFDLNDNILQNDNNYVTNWLKLFTNFDNKYKISIHK